MQKVFKCPYCNKKYIDKKALYEHIGSKHPEQIPVGMPVSQVYFNNKYKKTGGRCVICGKPTKWNETVEDMTEFVLVNVKAKYKADFSKKMIKKYGKNIYVILMSNKRKCLQQDLSVEYIHGLMVNQNSLILVL